MLRLHPMGSPRHLRAESRTGLVVRDPLDLIRIMPARGTGRLLNDLAHSVRRSY